ncbi:MarR family winged helix-turn-helix transcriptional regulator [Streptosporangium pseudovulgare]|uniref:Transcriptional regulator, MarR family protein n=1 Tax=Streptosporangium pseudovulgare TaxID=35765 RepID=A0ABQ2RBT3_9ACTN|nr:MarR family winged helix-turn-helix transcriptional regulator [Streptosporangium pseudovulgare]GGQ23901.1 putative transcriptional regulator, MarR family protein [Streptosporangium pseudovulgare]
MTDRPDLAAMFLPLTRALIDAERPVLAEHDLSMWAYGVLLALEEGPLRTQAALAQSIGADKTRIIGVLDDLQRRGLIERVPDPADRRARLLSLTAEGRRLRDSAQAGIRRREERLLARLPEGDREGFLRSLRALAALPPHEITDPPPEVTDP